MDVVAQVKDGLLGGLPLSKGVRLRHLIGGESTIVNGIKAYVRVTWLYYSTEAKKSASYYS